MANFSTFISTTDYGNDYRVNRYLRNSIVFVQITHRTIPVNRFAFHVDNRARYATSDSDFLHAHFESLPQVKPNSASTR